MGPTESKNISGVNWRKKNENWKRLLHRLGSLLFLSLTKDNTTLLLHLNHYKTIFHSHHLQQQQQWRQLKLVKRNDNLVTHRENLPLSIGEADPLILPNTVESFPLLLFLVWLLLSLSLFLFASPPWWMHGLSLHICVYARVASIWDNGNSSSGKQPHNLCHQWHALSSLQGCQRCHQLCWNYLSPRSPRRLSLRLPPRQLLDHAHLWFSRTFCKPLPYFSSPLCITIATPTLSSTFFFLSPVLRTLMCCL